MDVKVYAFYGAAPMALLRRVVKHGEAKAHFRIIDRHGRDVATSYSGNVGDRSMEPPPRLEEMFEIAKKLFAAMGIARDDKPMRQDWVLRGFRQFDAPVSLGADL